MFLHNLSRIYRRKPRQFPAPEHVLPYCNANERFIRNFNLYTYRYNMLRVRFVYYNYFEYRDFIGNYLNWLLKEKSTPIAPEWNSQHCVAILGVIEDTISRQAKQHRSITQRLNTDLNGFNREDFICCDKIFVLHDQTTWSIFAKQHRSPFIEPHDGNHGRTISNDNQPNSSAWPVNQSIICSQSDFA